MTPQESPRKRRCLCGCNRTFVPQKPWQKFYAHECRRDYHRYGRAFGALKREGVRRLLKEAQAAIAQQYRDMLAQEIENVMQRNGWSDARTLAVELSPRALKGQSDMLARLLAELRRDHVQLDRRVKILEMGERRKLTELEARLRVLENPPAVR